MKASYRSFLLLLVCILFLTACAEVQAGTPEIPLSFTQLTPEYVGGAEFTSYIKSVKDLKVGCESALHQWQGYAQQAQDNPHLYQDSQWQGYMSGTIEWIDDTCGKFDMLNAPRMLIALHGQLATAAQNYHDFTTAYSLGTAHHNDHPELMNQARTYLNTANDAYNLAAIKLP